MAKYRVPVIAEVCINIDVEAESIEEAIELVHTDDQLGDKLKEKFNEFHYWDTAEGFDVELID